MNVRNRLADVVKLRCNACQDFIRLYLKDDWQQQLYNKAEYEVTISNIKRFKDKYVAVYENMRDNGIENYSVDYMDVTLIAELVAAKFNNLTSVQKETRNTLFVIKEDRNLKNHSNENEEAEELYLYGLLALTNLRAFIRAVDKYEVSIEDNIRLAFRQKYIQKINDLKTILDDERISLIYYTKEMDKDIDRILSSDNLLATWHNIESLYRERYCIVEGKHQKYFEFLVRASDKGISYAHSGASDYFSIKKDYVEAKRRLHMLYNSIDNFSIMDVQCFISTLFSIPREYYTCDILNMIENMRNMGFAIKENEEGRFYLLRKQKIK